MGGRQWVKQSDGREMQASGDRLGEMVATPMQGSL